MSELNYVKNISESKNCNKESKDSKNSKFSAALAPRDPEFFLPEPNAILQVECPIFKRTIDFTKKRSFTVMCLFVRGESGSIWKKEVRRYDECLVSLVGWALLSLQASYLSYYVSLFLL